MKIVNDTRVLFHYALVSPEGEVIDGSRGDEPLSYVHGHKNIVPGLEAALAEREVGDRFQVKVAPEQGYGFRDESKVVAVDRASFADFTELSEGMLCQMEDENGELLLVAITEIAEDEVTVDANHPYAGLELNFDVEVMEVREATPAELQSAKGDMA